MKNKVLVSMLCCMFVLTACGSDNSVKADKRMVCTHVSEYEDEQFTDIVTIDYDSETNYAERGEFESKLKYIRQENIARFAADFTSKGASIEELDGVEVFLEVDKSDLVYKEIWNYNDIVIEDIMVSEAPQKDYLTDDKISVNKIKKSYEEQNFSCEMSKKIPN